MVPKEDLIRNLNEIVARRDTGLLTIVTDSGRAVLLRFAHGSIVGAHSRTKDVGESIAVLAEAERVRFAFAPSAVDTKQPPLIPVAELIQAIHTPTAAPAQLLAGGTPAVPQPAAPPPRMATSKEARVALEQLAIELVGPLGQMLVEEALETAPSLGIAVDVIAKSIPDRKVGDRFVQEAAKRVPGM
jgi:hypothetical protein